MRVGIYDHQLPCESHDIFDVTFFDDQIRTVVTHCKIPVDAWISEIERIHRRRLHRLVVGLDVEWRPNFRRGIQNPVAILQLCVGRHCLIFQLIYADTIPRSLIDFLSNENYSFVGVGVQKDVEKLEDDYGLRVVGNVIDLCELAADKLGRNDLKNVGLKALAWEVLGKEIQKPKRVTMSKWDQFLLTHEQVQYACVDSFISFEIGRILKDQY